MSVNLTDTLQKRSLWPLPKQLAVMDTFYSRLGHMNPPWNLPRS
jgi:hypothetical protein